MLWLSVVGGKGPRAEAGCLLACWGTKRPLAAGGGQRQRGRGGWGRDCVGGEEAEAAGEV